MSIDVWSSFRGEVSKIQKNWCLYGIKGTAKLSYTLLVFPFRSEHSRWASWGAEATDGGSHVDAGAWQWSGAIVCGWNFCQSDNGGCYAPDQELADAQLQVERDSSEMQVCADATLDTVSVAI